MVMLLGENKSDKSRCQEDKIAIDSWVGDYRHYHEECICCSDRCDCIDQMQGKNCYDDMELQKREKLNSITCYNETVIGGSKFSAPKQVAHNCHACVVRLSNFLRLNL